MVFTTLLSPISPMTALPTHFKRPILDGIGLGNHILAKATNRHPEKRRPSRTLKDSFQVNGFGGAELVRAKEMDQFGIIPVDQGVYLFYAESSAVSCKFFRDFDVVWGHL